MDPEQIGTGSPPPITTIHALKTGLHAMTVRPEYTGILVVIVLLTQLTSGGVFGNAAATGAPGMVMFLLYVWAGAGCVRVALDAMRDHSSSLKRFVVPPYILLQLAVVMFVVWLAFGVGTLLFLVPGLYILARWSMATYLILDGRATWFSSLKVSARFMDGYKMTFLRVTGAVSLLLLPGMLLNFYTLYASDSLQTVMQTGQMPMYSTYSSSEQALLWLGYAIQTITTVVFFYSCTALYELILRDHTTRMEFKELDLDLEYSE